MKPGIDKFLLTSSAALFAEVAPRLAGHYVQGSVTMQAFLQMLAATEFNRAASNRSIDNAGMRKIFRSAARACPEPELKERMERAAKAKEVSLLVADLDASGVELRNILIAVHTLSERTMSPWGQKVSRACLRFMASSASRNLVQVQPM